jgi:alkylhydroperoxidase family enzyme
MLHRPSSWRRAWALALCTLAGAVTALSAQPPARPPEAKGQAPAAPRPADEDAARAARWLQEAFRGQPTPEAVEMLIAIARGSGMGPGEGWFHPGQARYGWPWLAHRHGVPPDGAIPRARFLGSPSLFARLDRNKDGQLRADDFDWSDRSPYAQQQRVINYLFRMMNKQGDGRLTRDEWIRFFDQAAGGKGHLTTDNLHEALTMPPPAMPAPADMPTPQMLVRGLFRGEVGSMNDGPRLNDPAPDFTLKTRDGKETVRLSDHFGKKPIVLMFGNLTCSPFRWVFPRVDDVARRYEKEALFLGVYVREAHPTDGWRLPSNESAGVKVGQPRDYAERCTLAGRCGALLKMSFPLLVDEMDDRVGNAYSGMPSRLYIIDRAGKIAYKSGRGPWGFRPDEMEQALVLLLLDEAAAAGPQAGRFPLLDNAVAWKRLPPPEKGAGQPLPAWARALAGPLPRTTAALLELDHAQRAHSPLDPKLRGRLRWAAAQANGCAWGQACAAADLRRAGVGEEEIRALGQGEDRLPAPEREALAFARKMMRAADTVTDEEVARLLKHHGEKQVVALVLLLAYANFQDRLVLYLGLHGQEGATLPPLEVRFREEKKSPATKEPWPNRAAAAGPSGAVDPERVSLTFEKLQEQMESQRGRRPRIRVPSWEELRKQGTPARPDGAPLRIRWSLVCQGYQPALAGPWFKCLRTFADEAAQDRVFEESLFWVVTRSLRCFY